ncbi:MAG: 1-acyl-sn-glycerol-3-phosphate acyltransferase [Acidobacteria bacterium]|nr:1-acyl-sn-glycerol-3-phosphate acyltransferase [Acidobacteriota bacterium]
MTDAVALVGRHAKGDLTLRPDANLELDLGLDSMERVELLTELEQRFGMKVPEVVVHEIATVRQLVEAVRPAEGAAAGAVDAAWPTLLADIPGATDPVLGRLLEPRPVVTRLLWLVAQVAGRVLSRVRVEGLDHLPAAGPYLICPNHQGYFDPLLLCSVLPYRVFRDMFVVGAAEYFQTPFTLWLARLVNLVPVDTDSALVSAMKAGAFGLAHGRVLLLFPEGERSIDGTVRRFKKGAPILAAHLGVPIVPVALKGLWEMWPRTKPIDWRYVGAWRRHRVRIAIGPTVTVSASEPYADAAARLRATVDELWQPL